MDLRVLQEIGKGAGFDRIGLAPAWAPEMDELGHFAAWVEAGYAGEMQYLKRRAEDGQYQRSSLESALPWAKSVIVAAINYNSSAPRSTEAAGADCGWISRYAHSPRDYHETVLGRLKTVEAEIVKEADAGEPITTRVYVDTGPVLERVYAKYAGIGWIGKNTCLIDQQLGSWFFLGVIVTSIDASQFGTAARQIQLAPDRCGSCTRCIDACPTNAIVAPRQLDASRCIAYFTIEKRGTIPEEMRDSLGRHIFGCDVCQDVCPWNRKAPMTANEDFAPDSALVNPDLSDLADISAEEFRRRFRGSPIWRAKHSGFLRNVAIAMGNSGERRFLRQLQEMSTLEDPVVAEHARWAIERLDKETDSRAQDGNEPG